MTTPPPVPEGSKAKMTLTGSASTLMITLLCRMQDCQTPDPILNDKWAEYVAKQMDYDYSTIDLQAMTRDNLSLRALYLDRWTGEFLDAHKVEDVTILKIACGLDARSHRVRWGPNVRWIDLDLPPVIELRRKLLPGPSGYYSLVAGSALDANVLKSIPNDRPTAVVMEGLLYYLEEADGHRLIRQLCERFPSGELIFDVISPAFVITQQWAHGLSSRLSSGQWMKKQGTGFVSGSDPWTLDKLRPKLKLRMNVPWTEMEGMKNPTLGHRFLQALAWLPIPRFGGSNLRHTF